MAADVPQQMRALLLDEYRESIADAVNGLKVGELPLPKPEKGQVLVRIEAAPCNPSDLLLLQGKYGTLKKLPTVPGWEGAGEVVASGGGLLANWLTGKRVACGLRGDRNGTWSEFFIAKAAECVPLKREVTFEQGAGLIINPFTALGLLETAPKAVTARRCIRPERASSGECCKPWRRKPNTRSSMSCAGIRTIELLKSLGAAHVLNSSSDSFPDELKAMCERLGATIAFEAVSGEMTGIVVNAMPRHSKIYVYGALSEEPCSNIDPVQLIFHDKEVKGFYLGTWMRRRGTLGILRTAGRIQRMIIDGRIESVVQRRVGLDDAKDGLRHYVGNMTQGKVLITPHGRN